MKNLYSLRSHLILLVVLLVTGAATTSCNKIKDAIKVNFGLNYADLNFAIQPTSQSTFTTSSSKSSTLQAELDKNKAAVDKVVLKSVLFELQAGSASNFGAISSGECYLTANGQSAKLGSFQNPASNTQSISVTVENGDDLKQYLQASQFTVELRGTTRQAIQDAMQVKGTIKFEVTGKAK
ncbi:MULTISPECIES: hypothetical protein [Hymenobacter]|uniref:Uncharacterized protein n=1 Tax=Hymenobacter jejuensis TaxID=2502781 RepID=A0A5B7ZUP3_9BACT|nr:MULTISPECIES: hypothetical protein [Hymenobacter]MBC6989113.1 hypothetical protein [Hymenobacter sp. BT491]QDA58680.1 hypothetical protein FHG12_00545 [Hymenobacter jejuensis]